MPTYLVELRGDAREVYAVEADDPADAPEKWHTGTLVISEASGMDVESIRLNDEQED
jgi:hypothetical protein